ncbi:tRNA epoxyqueuosine(34) reductase QueG [Alkalibacter rhizosphaerae]|uniref:tRNA epoxyqueuosine(34) reductase QueG n=1 Tax=Alkalibacter rhizosphaerae TaxID=2815577 RepID=A0A974XGH0_9FIRM|nr:tRNA epoxyqueuosine(34) reductase QueG [Alkalibacter rhizosphaerae]QSX08195.1 tRNA epoxyqueuosine(34) reductase QueG [Alkalibacter rhizosphaerae]
MEFQEIATRSALELGFTLVGVTVPNPREELQQRVKNRNEEGGLTPFTPNGGADLMSVEKQWPFCRSVLSLGLSYNSTNIPVAGPGEGVVARIGLGRDYHLVIQEKIWMLMDELKKMFPDLVYEYQVDNGPLSDRASAWEAGLGFFGKNSFIIHPDKGSYINLAQVFTNQPVSAVTKPLESRCGTCTKCMDACPTHAIGSNGSLHGDRCISYLTQKKGVLMQRERTAMGRHLYGCDICQEVCPFNKSASLSSAAELRWDGNREIFQLDKILSMTKRVFKDRFGQRAAGWRGKSLLQRNALIVCGNEQTPGNRDLLLQYLSAPGELLRIHALYSLEKYGEKERKWVQKALETESESFRNTYEEYR